jgi:hypothetical protein
MVRVRCYAGSRYPERPLAFEWEGAWMPVGEVLRQARLPDGLLFVVRAADGKSYRLKWHTSDDSWRIARSRPLKE